MVFSYYLLKYPYSLMWSMQRLLGRGDYYAAYCGDVMDYHIMEPVLKYLPELKIISKDKKVQAALAALGVKSTLLPAFPRGVLMCRLAGHKFPADGMKKIGMRHGPFHFKALSDKANYNIFDHFIFTSEHEAELAAKAGIINGEGIGYPKLDKAFDGKISTCFLDNLSAQLGLSPEKRTLLFTATWEGSQMSAIDKWFDRLTELKDDYNLLVSLHPWTGESYREKVKNTAGVHYIESYDTTPYIMLADICIGDTSSMLGECCALDKPMITFRMNNAGRMVDYVIEMLERISVRIERFEEISGAIASCDARAEEMSRERETANELMFSNLDGSAGKKVADFIRAKWGI